MKFNPQRFREQSSAWFGKRGMSWHGTAVVLHPDVVLPWPLDIRTFGDCQRKVLYIQDIIGNDIQQDQFTALSILQAVLAFLKTHVPAVTKAVLQSDNAGCYSSSVFVVGAGTLHAITGIRVVRIVRTEAQDGKSFLYSQFGLASQALARYVDEGNNIITPLQLVEALKSVQLANTVVRMVQLDVHRLAALSKSLDKSFPHLAKLRSYKDVQFADDGMVFRSFVNLSQRLLIPAADLSRWWTPTNTGVTFLEQAAPRRKHRSTTHLAAPASPAPNSSDADRQAALLAAGFTTCDKCGAEYRSTAEHVCVRARSMEMRASQMAVQSLGSPVVGADAAAPAEIPPAVRQALQTTAVQPLAAGWAINAHNTQPMSVGVAARLQQMFDSETDRHRVTVQQALEKLEQEGVPIYELPSEQQVSSFIQTAVKKRAAGVGGAGHARTCRHCKGAGHDVRTCPFKRLSSADAQAAQKAANGATGQAAAALPSPSIPTAAAAGQGSKAASAPRKRKAVECQHCHGIGHNQAGCKWKTQGLNSQDAELAQRREQGVGVQL